MYPTCFSGIKISVVFQFIILNRELTNFNCCSFRERELEKTLDNIRLEYSAAKMEIELLQNTQDDSPSKSSCSPGREGIGEKAECGSAISDDLVMADDDEISDEEELFNKMLITDQARRVEGEENEQVTTGKQGRLSDKDDAGPENGQEPETKVRVRPIGKSPDPVSYTCKLRL